jgi:glucokinase
MFLLDTDALSELEKPNLNSSAESGTPASAEAETPNQTMSYSIGVDLGGSSIKLVAVDREGRLLEKRNEDFDTAEPMQWAEGIRARIAEVRSCQGTPAAIGLSAPGLVHPEGNSIAHMPERLQGLEGLNWSKYLGLDLQVPVLNDGHAALLGEAWLGAARGRANVIMLTLGTGVGGAAIVDGRLLRGRMGRAGHLGHLSLDPNGPADVCATPGSLELMIGNCTIRERAEGRFESTHALVAASRAGNPEARAIWLKSVRALAAAIASFVNILDPEAVVIGGGIARAGEALFEPLQWYLDSMEWRPGGCRVELLPAQLGEFAGAYGSAYNAQFPDGLTFQMP